MEKRAKVYLDTSVISALFDLRTPERQSLTQSMWQVLPQFEVYISITHPLKLLLLQNFSHQTCYINAIFRWLTF